MSDHLQVECVLWFKLLSLPDLKCLVFLQFATDAFGQKLLFPVRPFRGGGRVGMPELNPVSVLRPSQHYKGRYFIYKFVCNVTCKVSFPPPFSLASQPFLVLSLASLRNADHSFLSCALVLHLLTPRGYYISLNIIQTSQSRSSNSTSAFWFSIKYHFW
jgi:hypothetical protein